MVLITQDLGDSRSGNGMGVGVTPRKKQNKTKQNKTKQNKTKQNGLDKITQPV